MKPQFHLQRKLNNPTSRKVFALIRSATGHDFSQYKQTTIRRRIERRLAVHQIDKLPDYIVYMQKDPLEIDALFKDLVIGVTSFFRDPEAYQVLEQKVLPNLLHGRKPDDPLRCWVVGCSTGEEAYSLAVIVSEAMEKLKKYFSVQIFATDIDAAAIENASKSLLAMARVIQRRKKQKKKKAAAAAEAGDVDGAAAIEAEAENALLLLQPALAVEDPIVLER